MIGPHAVGEWQPVAPIGRLTRYPSSTPEERPGERGMAPAEEARLARQAQAGDRRARERMMEANRALVMSVARKFQCASMELEDLAQEGILGLARAIDLFDPGRGLRFSTYAVHWIRQSITRAIDNKARLIRVPVNTGYSALRAERTRQELTQELGRPPTVEEIAAEIGEPVRRVGRLLDGLCETVSLEGVSEGTDRELPDPKSPTPEAVALQKEEQAAVRGLVAGLPERERRVIERRFGLDDEESWTLRELADEMGVTPQAVRRIEVRALKRLHGELQMMA